MIEIVTQNLRPVNEPERMAAVKITIQPNSNNTKPILTLLEEMGYSLPCNCHGRHRCSGHTYSFDCSMVPVSSITVDIPEPLSSLSGIALEDKLSLEGKGDTVLIDLGTTTIALALIDKTTKELRRTVVFENPGKHFGADIISRIHASVDGYKDELRQELQKALMTEVTRLCQSNKQTLSDISSCYIGGNTAMIHILMGYDCTPFTKNPFILTEIPVAPFSWKDCRVCIMPWLSAFIGGDITSGIYACGLDSSTYTTLFVDLGTNGEMVLCHDNKLYLTSTAAGPAFEGGNLSCGCAAVRGAITNVRLRTLQPALSTIEGTLPIGICGSGALSLCAELLRKKYVTQEGIITEKFPMDGIFLGTSAQGKKLYFTRDDFRQVQTGIAAIAAGIHTLLQEAGITHQEVSTLYLGGGFGFFLNPDDCDVLHLFSSIEKEKVKPLGNTCLAGLFQCACNDICDIPMRSLIYIPLAGNSVFEKSFLHHMAYED